MDRTERFYRIHALLRSGRAVPMQELKARLEVSRATLTRDLEYLRDRMGAPIVWDPAERGYRYNDSGNDESRHFELPGLWLSESEIRALLTLAEFTESLDPHALLGPLVKPLKTKLAALTGNRDIGISVLKQRIRLIPARQRMVQPAWFETVASALLGRQRIALHYQSRLRDAQTEREVSPQRLIHYSDNWYLDAWCHWRKALRRFSLDAIVTAEMLPAPAHEVSTCELDSTYGDSYGIFSGPAKRWAVLRFSQSHSRWVRHECWHPRQRKHVGADGCVLLEVPFGDPRELLLDLLRHGAHVEVIAPAALRAAITEELALALENYTR